MSKTATRAPKLPGLGRIPRPALPPDLVLAMQSAGGESDLERLLLAQLRTRGLPDPIPQFIFAPRRRWRFDFAWPSLRLAVEAEGGVWTNGRHNRPHGIQEDMRKYNAASIQGWMLLRYPEARIRSGQAVDEIEAVIRMKTARESPL